MTKRTKKVGVTGKYGTRYVINFPDPESLHRCAVGEYFNNGSRRIYRIATPIAAVNDGSFLRGYNGK